MHGVHRESVSSHFHPSFLICSVGEEVHLFRCAMQNS